MALIEFLLIRVVKTVLFSCDLICRRRRTTFALTVFLQPRHFHRGELNDAVVRQAQVQGVDHLRDAARADFAQLAEIRRRQGREGLFFRRGGGLFLRGGFHAKRKQG